MNSNDTIDISKYDKRDVLIALYDNARVQGMGFLQATNEPLTQEKAGELLKRHTYFDYLYGRVMKVELSGDQLHPGLYDRDNGHGAAADAIAEIQHKKQDEGKS